MRIATCVTAHFIKARKERTVKITVRIENGVKEVHTEFPATETLRLLPLLNQLTANAEMLREVLGQVSEASGPFIEMLGETLGEVSGASVPIIQVLGLYLQNPSALLQIVEQWSNSPSGGATIAKMMELWIDVQRAKGVYDEAKNAHSQKATPTPPQDPNEALRQALKALRRQTDGGNSLFSGLGVFG